MEAENVNNRKELVTFVHEMIEGFRKHPDQWENRDIPSFLAAMAAWLDDCEGYYRGHQDDRNVEHPDWQIFADALTAATVYE